jgi:hypothetical protein
MKLTKFFLLFLFIFNISFIYSFDVNEYKPYYKEFDPEKDYSNSDLNNNII